MEPDRTTTTPSPAEVARLRQRVQVYRERLPVTLKNDPRVVVTLGGKDLTLEFTNRAVKDILTDCGVNLLRDSLTDAHLEDPDILGAILHRGLQKHQPDLSRAETDDLFSMRFFPYISDKLREALDIFYPDMSDLPPLAEREGGEADPP